MPEDPVTGQLWMLLQLDFPEQQLVRTVQLFQEISWSSMVAEQQHGSLASLKRVHPEYQMETLVARAQVMMLWRLLPKPSENERALLRLERQLARLGRQNPAKAGGRQMYLEELFNVLRHRAWVDRPRPPQHPQDHLRTTHCEVRGPDAATAPVMGPEGAATCGQEAR